MNKRINPSIILYGVILLMFLNLNSCIKEGPFILATVETSQVSSITEATANCGGIITADGGLEVISRGVCWDTMPNPTINNDTTKEVLGNAAFTSSIKGLTPGTTYYVRAYAENKDGVAYGLNVIFETKTLSITTTPISLVTATTAICGGSIVSNGDSGTLTIKTRGVCWSIFPSPTIENGKTIDGVGGGRFSSYIDSLTPFTTYYVRSYATNSNGTFYGNEMIFKTLNGVIEISTEKISSIKTSSAISGGNITSNGGSEVIVSGVCWATTDNPTIADSKSTNGSKFGEFSSSLIGLSSGTTYYVRAYATNRVGTSYGNQLTFESLANSGTITDVEGNTYNFITIGTQAWMIENLKTTKFNDGTNIPYVTSETIWANLSSASYCFYNNDVANKNSYGILYNWYAVNTGKLAPSGWHVSTVEDWNTLENYLIANGYNYDGTTTGNKIAKSLAASTGWNTSIMTGAIGRDLTKNNSSGFTALPGGYRGYKGSYYGIGELGYMWCSNVYSSTYAWSRLLYNYYDYLNKNFYDKPYGLYVRCVRDN